jgi:hypothetical protein
MYDVGGGEGGQADKIALAQNRDKRWSVLNAIINIRVP